MMGPVSQPRLFLIDSFGFIFRAYHARARSGVPPMRTSTGLSTEAVYIFNNMLRKLAKTYQPAFAAAVFESSVPTHRVEEFAQYKANRTEMPADLGEQIPYVRRVLEAMRIPILEYPGFEADDVIGTIARRVSESDALDHVLGYTCINDVSARDLQFADKQFVRSKSLDTFCPLGPAIVTRDEIPNPNNLRIKCTLNGQVMQDHTTADMIFDVPTLIESLSSTMTLRPGSIILTGTPPGCGFQQDPPSYLRDGDMIEASIDALGRMRTRVRSESTSEMKV